MLAGRSPVLPPGALPDLNAGGDLRLVCLHFALRDRDLGRAETQRVLSVANAAFYFFTAGYRLHTLLHEVYGLQHAEYMRAGGFRLHAEFAAPAAALPPERRPYLFRLTRDEIQLGAVHQLSFLFHPPVPRFGFTLGEQRVLEAALLNEADVEAAQRLGVSVDAVKKTWQSIYRRAGRASPALLDPEREAGPAGADRRRGAEKRRHVLDYLRSHLEELRPVRGQASTSYRSAPRTRREVEATPASC